MKRKGLSLLVGLQVAFLVPFIPLAQADIIFQGAPDVCTKLPGAWVGQGTVKALNGLVNCTYSGAAQVEAANTKNATNDFKMNIHLTKEKGLLCPASESLSLAGTCDNGLISLKTSEVDLKGNLDSTGTQINDVVGTITFVIKTGSVTANVSDMNLHKS